MSQKIVVYKDRATDASVYPVTLAEAVVTSNGSDLQTYLDSSCQIHVSQNTTTGETVITKGTGDSSVVADFTSDYVFNVCRYREVASYANATTARNDVPTKFRKIGLQVTYNIPDASSNNVWYTDQYNGSDVSGWGTESNWSSLQVDGLYQKVSELDSSLNEAADDIQAFKDGSISVALADNITSWSQRSQYEIIDEWSDKVRTTAGSLSIDSSKSAYILHIECRGSFKATSLAASGENLLNPSVTIGSAYVFQVPKLIRGNYGTAEEANGILFVDNDGNNLHPSVRWSESYPTSDSSGSAVTPYQFTGHSEYFYPSIGEGWFIVSGLSVSASNVCARIAWSKNYNKYVAYTAPSTVNLSNVISAISSIYSSVSTKILSVGGTNDLVTSEATFDSSVVSWVRKVSAVLPTWVNTKISEEGQETDTYRHTATIPSTNGVMKSDGLAEDLDSNVGLHVDGTTVYYDDHNATSSVVVKYELNDYVTGTLSQVNSYAPNDMGIEYMTDVDGDFVVRTSYYQAYPDTVATTVSKVEALEEQMEIMQLTQPLFIAGLWLNNTDTATNSDKDNVNAIKVLGSKEWALNWIPCLFDMTPVEGEVKKAPIGQLKKNNWLRFIDGTFAPVVGITTSMYNECMENTLYTDSTCTTEYCASGEFDAEEYYTNDCSVLIESGVYKLSCTKLYKAVDTEVTHYLMPWETTETKYSIFLCRKDKVYCVDNLVGASGKEWSGVFGSNFNFWDGEDIGVMPLESTGIAPSPVTAITENGTIKLRSFFFNYSSDMSSCNGCAGTAKNCKIFLGGGHYPLVVTGQQNYMKYARNNNYDASNPYPCAEAGYHAHNTFLKCIECAYGTKYLAKSTRFSSGVSSNDACSSESTWKANGGIRWKKSEDSSWNYNVWYSSSHGIYKDASGGISNLCETINNYNLHSMTLQDQIAVSFATELNIPASSEFEFCGSIFRYEDISDGTFAPTTLSNGKMNCRVYKIVSGTFNAYNADGSEQSFDVEVMLRTGLMEGCNASGDGGIYRGGGAEIIGLCTIDPSVSRYGNQLLAYAEPDQTKWVYDSTITNELNTKFLAEKRYKYLGTFTPTTGAYVRRHVGHTFLPKQIGSGSIAYGESCYAYMSNYWGSLNQRVRIGLRFGYYAYSSHLSPRCWHGSYSAANTYTHSAGSAQVLVDASKIQ